MRADDHVGIREHLEALELGVYGIDPEGRCTFANAAALRVLGYGSEADLLGRNMHDAIHHTRVDGRPYPRHACPLLGAMHTRLPVSLDCETLWRADGTSFVAEYSSSPVIRDGVVVGCTVSFQAVSARRDAQGRLAMQHAVGEALANASSTGAACERVLSAIAAGIGGERGSMWATKGDGPLLPLATWGRSDPVVVPPPVAREAIDSDMLAHHGDDRCVAFPLRAGRHVVGVLEVAGPDLRMPDGVEMLAATLGQQVGQFLARRAVEGDLLGSEALRAAVLESALDGIVIIDSEGAVVDFNPAAERIFGRFRADVVGRDMADLIVPADFRAKHRAGMTHHKATGEGPLLGKRIEVEALRAHGARFPLELAITATDVGGRHLFVAYVRDITERRKAQADLAAARDAAEAANRAKSTFIANMSHELRTPLAAIIGYGEMLIEEAEDAGGAAGDLRRIEANARHLLGLINDVLDISKIESGKMELFVEEFDVAALLDEIAAMARPLADRNSNAVVAGPWDGLGTMRSDVTKLKQVLLNLVGNALKFTERGHVHIEAVRREGTVTFTVRDDGIGMSPDQVSNLFRRFHQADASTTRRFGGTGLGLSISKAFVDMLGGTLSVHSAEGGGSSFAVALPVTTAP